MLQQTANANPDAWKAKLNPDEAACRADSRYLDLVVDNLRREDRRWGYNCKRGNCSDPSHDVVAYYFGTGEPYEGAPQVMLVDMITATCAPNARPGWLVLEFTGSGAGWTSKGRFASGPRQNVTLNCPKSGASAPASVAPLRGSSAKPQSSRSSSSPARSGQAAPREAKPDGVIGGSSGEAPVEEAPGPSDITQTGGTTEESPK